MPLPIGSRNSDHGVLCSNHERNVPQLMFPGMTEKDVPKMTKDQAEVEMASQGHTFFEIKREGRAWKVVTDSQFNRRFTPFNAEFRVAGPAAGHARLKTAADPQGLKVIGTLNNCAGGKTPWGTVLSGEENLHNYFTGDASKGSEANAWKRYGINGRGRYVWGNYHDRFNLDKEPNETNRFGWIVEMDPYDPKSTPVKRTAMGRFKHEGATTAVSHNGQVAVYSGDDERFEYVYKFVTKGKFDPRNRRANMNLLDEGTLHAAKFEENGRMRWLPLVFGENGLTPANGFNSQADVVIEARRAADLVGATPMDRPEDIEPNPLTGRVYVVLTYNERRKPANDPDVRARQPGQPPPQQQIRPDHRDRAAAGERQAGPHVARVSLGVLPARRRPQEPRARRHVSRAGVERGLGLLSRQRRLRSQGPRLDLHRRPGRRHRLQRLSLRRRHAWARARHHAPVLQRPPRR